MKRYKVNNIIVGHTPLLNNGIGNACDGHIWLTDYGASKAFDKYDKLTTTSESEVYKRSSHRSEKRK